MKTKRVAIAVLTTALIGGSTLAFAQGAPKKPLGKLTCEEFLAMDDTFKPKMVYWAAAYGKGGKPEAAMLDVEGTEKVIPVIIEKCKSAPKDSFYSTTKSAMKAPAK